MPNSQSALLVDGFTRETMKNGFTLSLIEKAGDGSPWQESRRYCNEQVIHNAAKTADGKAALPVVVYILSNSLPENVLTAHEWRHVGFNRFYTIECSAKYPLIPATDYLRKNNGLPPLEKKQKHKHRSRGFRLSDLSNHNDRPHQFEE